MDFARTPAGAANCGQSMRDAGKGKHTLQQQPIINSTDAVPDISFASHQQVPCALEPCRRASASSGVAAADIDLAAARIPPHVCMKSFAEMMSFPLPAHSACVEFHGPDVCGAYGSHRCLRCCPTTLCTP